MIPDPDVSALWEAMVRNSPIGVCLVEPGGRLVAANDALCAMLAYSEEELRQLTYDQITHPDDLVRSARELRRAVRDKVNLYRIAKRYRRSDGEDIWVDLTVALVHDSVTRELRHFVCQVVDVTQERHQRAQLETALADLRSSQHRAAAVMDAIDVGLVLINDDGSYGQFNRCHAVFLQEAFPEGHAGRAGEEGFVFGADGTTPLTSEQMPSTRAVAGEEYDDLRVWVGAEEGARRALSVSSRLVRGGEGENAGVVLAYHDITELVTAVKARDRFLASVSHELRSPLTAVLTHLELLLDDTALSDETRRQAMVIQRNAVRLASDVATLVDVAHPLSTTIPLRPEWVDVATLVDEVLESLRPSAQDAGLTLAAHGEAPARCFIDASRMRQVLDNLVVNAIKYSTRPGELSVELSHDAVTFGVTVRDRGVGIAEADLPHVFEPFYRADPAHGRPQPGIGLGLSIAHEVVTAHGGSLEVESEPGQGAAFHVRCPVVIPR